MKNLKINMKKIAFILGMTASSMVLVTGCGKREKKSLYNSVRVMQDNTCFDEIVSENSLKEVSELRDYIELSRLLKKSDYDRYEIPTECMDLMPIRDIKVLLAAYKEAQDFNKEHFINIFGKKDILSDLELEYVVDTLNIQERLVNEHIYNGYSLMEDVVLKELKALKLDAMGLDESNYSSVTIPASNESGYRDKTADPIQIGDGYTIDSGTKYVSLLGNLYDIESQPDIKATKRQEYNKDRNKLIEKTIDNAIRVIDYDYSVGKKKKVIERKRKN